MNRIVIVLFIGILLLSCKKSESDFLWEKTYQPGAAYFIKSLPDSGFYACGESGDNPYFVLFNEEKNPVLEFKADIRGLFNSAWLDKSGSITAGSTEGRMLLMHHSRKGNLLWVKTLDAGFNVDITTLLYTGNGNLIAIASASPDSSATGATGLMFVRFDTTGLIITQKKISETSFIAVGDAVIDQSGNIYMAITRRAANSNSKSTIAKYNDLFQKLWETELYNNPDFGAASISDIIDKEGNIYVTGYTEVPASGGNLLNSFVTSLANSGTIRWKRYLENSNSGMSLVFDDVKNLVVLNKNCLIIYKLNILDGADAGILRPYSLCVSEDTDSFGRDFDFNYDKNILLAGSKGGSFYLAIKSAQ